MLRTKALVRFAHDGHSALTREEEMIKQINEFIDWPALEKLLTPTDREVYEAMKSECRLLMTSESPDHKTIQRLIREGREFLITNPRLDPVSARELWREFVCSLSNDNTEESREEAETRLEMMYENRRETSWRKSVI